MNLEHIWQQDQGKDDMLNRVMEKKDFDKNKSKLPLKKLKNNLLAGIVLATLITIAYIILIAFIPIWQVEISLGILITFNLWIMILSWQLYKSIHENTTPTNSLKEELQKNYTAFQKWWRIQERLGLFVYPIAATGGFIMGGVLWSDKSVEDFLYHPSILVILGITIVILVPLCYYGAKWMFNYAYGTHLKKLKQMIDELSV